jgi:hypothetical protein
LLALTKDDLLPEGLRIDRSAFEGKAADTKNRKTRIAPIPASLRAELEEWAAKSPLPALFEGGRGALHRPAIPPCGQS